MTVDCLSNLLNFRVLVLIIQATHTYILTPLSAYSNELFVNLHFSPWRSGLAEVVMQGSPIGPALVTSPRIKGAGGLSRSPAPPNHQIGGQRWRS